jgi:hypothetical protein
MLASVSFVGALPNVGMPDRSKPACWEDVVKAEEQGKEVIAVTAGRLDFDARQLVIPAMEA